MRHDWKWTRAPRANPSRPIVLGILGGLALWYIAMLGLIRVDRPRRERAEREARENHRLAEEIAARMRLNEQMQREER